MYLNKRFVSRSRSRTAKYAEERVFFDGSPETVEACSQVVVELAAVVFVPPKIDCISGNTPQY